MQALTLAFALVILTIASAANADWIAAPDSDVQSGLTPTLAAELLAVPGPVLLQREDTPIPSWTVISDGKTVGYVGSTWELSGSTGYSGRPVDVLVAVTPEAGIAGAKLVRHNEPILTLGITDEDIAAFVGAFAGVDLGTRDPAAFRASPDLPDVISRATVSTGVIRDAILRTGRTLALGHGLIPGNGGIDRVSYAPRDWAGLVADGALVNTRVSMAEAHDALAAGRNPPEPGEGAFLDLWVGLIDPPTVGRNLLGQQVFSRAVGNLGLSDAALFVGSAGLHSHRGTAWRRSGVFDRIAIRQGDLLLTLTDGDYLRLDDLEIAGAPDLKERSIFRLAGEGFDPTAPFTVDVTATRPSDGEPVTMVTSQDFALPQQFRQAIVAPDLPPLWQSSWETKRVEVASVGVMLGALTLILLFQESLTRRRRLYRAVRLGFLTVTLVWLGWILNGQLSVVQVVAFLHALLLGFRWETFLIEPIIFTLWGFVALGLLFWGRGVFCGWLCPFGALQELTNVGAKLLRIPQVAVPQALHERLWIIKYTLFIAIVALSFYSMEWALKLAEVEPFKTAVSMRMMRAWPFVVFVVALLVAGLFIERFYCRYLCPLGAGLAIPAKLKIFDWLHRRPQCGRECHLCEQKCTVGAIDPLGRINPNECILCLKCQWIFHDESECTVLKKRARARAQATGATS